MTQRTRLTSRRASTRGAHPRQNYQQLWAATKPNQPTAIQLQTEKHSFHQDAPASSGQAQDGPWGKTPSLSQEWNPLLTQGAKRQNESQVMALEFPQSPCSPLPFLLTAPGGSLRKPCTSNAVSNHLFQFFFFQLFIENATIGCPTSHQRSLYFRSWQSNPSVFSHTH